MIKKEKVLGIDVCISSYNELKEKANEDIENNKKSFIVAINPEKILKARKDEKLYKLLNCATYQIPDGIGVIIASKLSHGKIRNRITGIDSMNMLLSLANEKKYKVFMYGAKEDVGNKAINNIKRQYPNINIVGYLNGYEQDNNKIISEINKTKAQILFVAMGSPKQENFIVDNMNKLCCNIYQGVGGSFDVFSGNIKRAPIWMQKFGLEWLYRLLREPKRIFRQLKLFYFVFLVLFKNKRGK